MAGEPRARQLTEDDVRRLIREAVAAERVRIVAALRHGAREAEWGSAVEALHAAADVLEASELAEQILAVESAGPP